MLFPVDLWREGGQNRLLQPHMRWLPTAHPSVKGIHDLFGNQTYLELVQIKHFRWSYTRATELDFSDDQGSLRWTCSMSISLRFIHLALTWTVTSMFWNCKLVQCVFHLKIMVLLKNGSINYICNCSFLPRRSEPFQPDNSPMSREMATAPKPYC